MVRFPFYCCLLSSRRRGQIKNQILPLIFIHLDLKKNTKKQVQWTTRLNHQWYVIFEECHSSSGGMWLSFDCCCCDPENVLWSSSTQTRFSLSLRAFLEPSLKLFAMSNEEKEGDYHVQGLVQRGGAGHEGRRWRVSWAKESVPRVSWGSAVFSRRGTWTRMTFRVLWNFWWIWWMGVDFGIKWWI